MLSLSDNRNTNIKVNPPEEQQLIQKNQSLISKLPKSLLVKIFEMFDLKTQVCILGLVNKEWQSTRKHEKLYERIYPSKKFLDELKKYPKFGCQARLVPDNLILLTNHADHTHVDVCIEILDCIKENFSVILAEGVPSNLINENVINYLESIVFSATFNFETNDSNAQFMKQKFMPGQDKKEFISKRIKILSSVVDQYSYKEQNKLEIAIALNFLKQYQFLEKAQSQGIEIMGSEPEDYVIRQTKSDKRDKSMLAVIDKCNKMGKGVFFDVGVEHGIELMKNLGKSKEKEKTVFVHFLVNKHIFNPESQFIKFISSLKPDTLKLPNLQFKMAHISIRAKPDEQKILNKHIAIKLKDSAKILMNVNNIDLEQYSYGCTLLNKGEYFRALHHLYIALSLYKENLSLCKEKSSPLQVAICYSTLASCHRDLNELDEAIKCCETALQICKENKIENVQVDNINLKLKGIKDLIPK